jgi:hypothetical protein
MNKTKGTQGNSLLFERGCYVGKLGHFNPFLTWRHTAISRFIPGSSAAQMPQTHPAGLIRWSVDPQYR